MWWFLLCLSIVSGSELNSIEFSVNYFKEANVKLVCLINCEDNLNWSYKFTKFFLKKQIFVSTVTTISFVDFYKLEKCWEQRFTSIGVLIDGKCNCIQDILEYASHNRILDSRHKWLILEEHKTKSFSNDSQAFEIKQSNGDKLSVEEFEVFDENNTYRIINKLNISVDVDIVIADKGFEKYNLYEVYNFGKVQGGELIINKLGSWNPISGFDCDLNKYKIYRRWNFQDWVIRMMTVVSSDPKNFDVGLIIGKQLSSEITVVQSKISSTVLHVIAEVHNFRYNQTLAERWYGRFNRNESSKVVATALYFQEQDISPIIRLMPGLFNNVDIVQPPLSSIETRYYYQIPDYGPGKFENQFIRPLTPNAWACVLAITVLCTMGLLMAAILEQRPSSVQYAVFSVFASFCQQFYVDYDDHLATRVSSARKSTIFVTGLSCLLIYNYYTSSVVSWLLNGPPPSIRSLQELLESPLQLIYEDVGYTRSWLQTPTYFYNKRNADVENALRQQKVFRRQKDTPIFRTVDEGIEMVKAGGYAYHTEVDSANRVISQKYSKEELCQLGSLGSMKTSVLFVVIQKNSPYKEFFNWSLLRVYEKGITACIQRRLYAPTVSCELSTPRALTLGGAAPAFLILLFGCMLGTIIMLIERFSPLAIQTVQQGLVKCLQNYANKLLKVTKTEPR